MGRVGGTLTRLSRLIPRDTLVAIDIRGRRMIRVVLILLCCASWVNAAPIPAASKAEEAEKQRKKWISELINHYDPVKPFQAAMALIDDPGSLPLLKELCRPMTATKADVDKWLVDLDSTDETDRAAAIQELVYFPPQEYFSAAELLEKCNTQRKLQGLHVVLTNDWNIQFDPQQTIQATKVMDRSGEDKIAFHLSSKDKRVTGGIRFHVKLTTMLNNSFSPTHDRSSLATLILHRKNSESAKLHLGAVIKGYDRGIVTKVARDLRDPKSKLVEIPPTILGQWAALTEPKEGFGSRLQPLLIVLNWIDRPASIKELRELLKPVHADKAKIRAWFKDLDSDDAKTKRTAHEMLGFHDPRLYFTDEELVKETEHSDTCKIRLYEIVSDVPQHEMANYYTNITVELKENTWTWYSSPRAQPSKRITIDTQQRKPVKDIVNSAWTRQRMAIIALERIGTPEAVAILKDLATGHPEVKPTREAMAAVERLKGKK